MFTLKQFMQRYPSDDACLEEIMARKQPACPDCGKTKFYRIQGTKKYSCSCSYIFSPLAGTIFHGSSTPLTSWFYVIYAMSQTRSGVSAMQIQRDLGVTYKTAWRMMHKVRQLMREDSLLEGEVEADETFFKPKAYKNTRVQRTFGLDGAQVLFGATTRGGGVRVRHIDTTGARAIQKAMKETVAPGAMLYTDGGRHYISMKKHGYKHESQAHWKKGEFIPGEPSFIAQDGMNTQNIENFWGHLKRGMYGVYRHCDPKYLETYANEYAFRYSHRRSEVPMFELLLENI